MDLSKTIIMNRFNYLLAGLCIGIALGIFIEARRVKGFDKTPEILSRDYIGVYTAYDILWIHIDNNRITTENGGIDTTFQTRHDLDEWMQSETSLQVRISEEIPKDAWVFIRYDSTPMPIVKDLEQPKILIQKDGSYRRIVDTIGWIQHNPSEWQFKITML